MAYMLNEKGILVPVSGSVPGNVIQREFTLSQDMGGAKAGEKIMLAVTPSDTAQVTELETYLGGYRNSSFLADIISPIVQVETEAFKRRDFSHHNAFAPVNDDVGRSGAINEIEHGSAVVEGKTKVHALAAYIPYEAERDAVGNYNVRASHAEMIREKLNLNREIRIMTKATTTTNWNASNYSTITTNYRWNTGTTKNPMADLRALIQASWAPVSGIAMNEQVAGYFLADSTVIAHVNFQVGTAGQKNGVLVDNMGLGTDGIQTIRIPGLPPIYVTQAKKFVSGAMTYILADDVVLFNAPASLSGGNTLASFVSFRTRGRSGTGYTVNEYVPLGRGLNSGTMIECGFADGDEIPGTGADSTTSRVGGLLKSVLTGS